MRGARGSSAKPSSSHGGESHASASSSRGRHSNVKRKVPNAHATARKWSSDETPCSSIFTPPFTPPFKPPFTAPFEPPSAPSFALFFAALVATPL
eukprot:644632-Pleurochrysis_carterae.AAC.1